MTTGSVQTGSTRVQNVALMIIAFGVLLFLLYQAQFILICLFVAIMLFSLTSAAIGFIARLHVGVLRIPNWLATIVALLLISTALIMLTSLVLSEINTVLGTTLTYAERTPRAVADLFAWLGPEAEAAVFEAVRSVNVSGYLRSIAGQAGGLMQGTVLVILFVGFLFGERVWFGVKLTNLLRDEKRAEEISDVVGAIMHRVNYYLLVKTLVSAVTGLMAFGVAQFFGVELATAIGVMTFVLNFIPNVGSIVATVAATLIAYVQFGDPGMTGVIFAVLTVIQFVNGNVVDPILMGRTLRLSAFGIIVSLAFWAALWGVPGMFLSVPIMVAIMIACSYVPALRPVAILLSREGLPETEPARRVRLFQATDRAAE